MTARAASRLTLVAAFAAVYVFWGATFLAIRWAVAELPPLLVMAIRCAGGALLLGAWGAVDDDLGALLGARAGGAR